MRVSAACTVSVVKEESAEKFSRLTENKPPTDTATVAFALVISNI
jgi:hypothetical protein